MIKIGDICPLFFNPIKDVFGIEGSYMQHFYVTDKILLQFFTDEGYVEVALNNLSQGTTTILNTQYYHHKEGLSMYYTTLTGLDDAIYSVTYNGIESEPFCVTSSEEILSRTTLIRYSHKDNNSAFDNIFWVENNQQVFEWRVEAGFKTNGYIPKLDNEQYRNQRQEIIELYAMPYDSYTLTMGSAIGVPYWFIRHLNRILCLSSVEIGGNKYVRSDNVVPEMTQVMEDVPLYNATIALEPQYNDIAGIGGRPEAASSSSVVGFAIDNPTDGQMLQYSEDESAFVNVTTVGV